MSSFDFEWSDEQVREDWEALLDDQDRGLKTRDRASEMAGRDLRDLCELHEFTTTRQRHDYQEAHGARR